MFKHRVDITQKKQYYDADEIPGFCQDFVEGDIIIRRRAMLYNNETKDVITSEDECEEKCTSFSRCTAYTWSDPNCFVFLGKPENLWGGGTGVEHYSGTGEEKCMKKLGWVPFYKEGKNTEYAGWGVEKKLLDLAAEFDIADFDKKLNKEEFIKFNKAATISMLVFK